MIKKYQKFKSYKRVLSIFLIVVAISSAVGAYMYTHSLQFRAFTLATESLFDKITSSALSAIVYESVFLLSVFIFGPTIYAPVSCFSTLVVYGLLFGARVAEKAAGELYAVIIELFFSALTAYLLTVYSSFATLTSLRIFTDVKDTKTKNSSELFDGVLFRAERFRGIFNMRYVASYIAFFCVFLLFVGTASVIKAFLLSLV